MSGTSNTARGSALVANVRITPPYHLHSRPPVVSSRRLRDTTSAEITAVTFLETTLRRYCKLITDLLDQGLPGPALVQWICQAGSRAIISTVDPGLARRFQAAVANPNTSVTYCYCSIFDEYWMADSQKDIQNPEPVVECPDFGDAVFRD